MEKHAPLEIRHLRERPRPDHDRPVAGQPPLGLQLRPVAAPPHEIRLVSAAERRQPLPPHRARRHGQPPLEFHERSGVTRRHGRPVRDRDLIGRRVVHGGQEVQALGHHEAPRGERPSDGRKVQQPRRHAAVRLARVAAAGTAIEGRLERIVDRAARVPAEDDQRRVEIGQVQAAENPRGKLDEPLAIGARDRCLVDERAKRLAVGGGHAVEPRIGRRGGEPQ